jgi:glutathionylspermidine synthase
MITEPFSQHLPQANCHILEPAWCLLMGNKGLLSLLWELFPDHPALVPSYSTPEPHTGPYVRKPLGGWEGENVSIIENGHIREQTQGDFAHEPTIYQSLVRSPLHQGFLAQMGVWMVNATPVALGIRESQRLIITNNSSFVPHVIC